MEVRGDLFLHLWLWREWVVGQNVAPDREAALAGVLSALEHKGSV